MDNLSSREKQILQELIHRFILTANPVGSNQISQEGNSGLKSASVRRVMAELEKKGYVYQPHTSAGRVPTTTGYRLYVDELLTMKGIHPRIEEEILESIEHSEGDIDLLMKNIAGVLANISKQLGVFITPKFEYGIFEMLQIVPVSSDKYMIIISVRDGQVKTILIELHQKIYQNMLKQIANKINQRFHGKSLLEIRNSFPGVMADLRNEKTGLVRLFSETADKLFDFNRYDGYAITGTLNIMQQPEFAKNERIFTLIELLEDKNIVIHLMGKREIPPGIRVTIGNEHDQKEIKECSVITSTYQIGDVSGLLGIIGPMRMPYHKMIPLIQFTAEAITHSMKS